MDTTIAIDNLKAMRSTIQSQVAGHQAQLDALDVAIGTLEGTLTTQLAELETAKADLASIQGAAPLAAIKE